eukprot:5916902-Prymnesium_polylepis.1
MQMGSGLQRVACKQDRGPQRVACGRARGRVQKPAASEPVRALNRCAAAAGGCCRARPPRSPPRAAP